MKDHLSKPSSSSPAADRSSRGIAFAPPPRGRHRTQSPQVAHEAAPVQMLTVAEANRAAFNQNPATPGKKSKAGDRLDRKMKWISGTDKRAPTLEHLPLLRDELDHVLSTMTDGMVASGGMGDQQSGLVMLKVKVTDLRQLVEYFYQSVIRDPEEQTLDSLTAAAADLIPRKWAEIRDDFKQVVGMMQMTNKTGEREPRSYRSAKDEPVDDSRIDLRAAMLAEYLVAAKFKPDIVVGLSTAGAHLATRVAGHLDAGKADLLSMTKIVSLRPKFVKKVGLDSKLSADEMAAENLNMLSRELNIRTIGKRGAFAMAPKVKVLVVDDFTLSGGSLATAKSMVSESLELLNFTPDVRTAVSRYTTAQAKNKLVSESGIRDNMIDYVVGPKFTGSREVLHDKIFTVEDGEDFYKDSSDPFIEALDQGLLEEGDAALELLGL